MVHEERAREISELNRLSNKVCSLHTNLLYYRNPKSKLGSICYEAWKTLVNKVGGSPNTWKDLGHALGLKQADLDVSMLLNKGQFSIIIKNIFAIGT